MSPRRNRPRGGLRAAGSSGWAAREAQEAGRGIGLENSESWRGEEWAVRRITGGGAVKPYRCPGCDQLIPPGVPHVVAWPAHSDGEDRRHWHGPCWTARDRRGVRPQRSRNAPRY
ncbi:ATP/GTP-binding protein [Streptomyces sp. JJ66]|uniref:ATP/GTP-binding protein n=1 Tax=Streptomyces sp. JJ66 TaxID=2803843 RepID=UPI001C568AB8|nr:ATP/GTP-binding protein [Streptomyces sp. JJ66]MBW1601497.1 ATP/GTP-binding protein [Streptomyces sp. JJ66]